MADPLTELSILDGRLNELVRTFTTNIQHEIISQRARGISDKAILANIKTQVANGSGRFGGIISGIGQAPTGAIKQIYSTAQTSVSTGFAENQPAKYILPRDRGYTYTVNEDGSKTFTLGTGIQETPEEKRQQIKYANQREEAFLTWVAAFHNTCEDCRKLSGQTQSQADWKDSGYWPGNGATVCGENCQCQLIPTTTLGKALGAEGTESEQADAISKQLENGIQLQKRKVEEIEKIRGEKFSDSTYNQKLGQIRTDYFNPSNRESVFLKKPQKSLGKGFTEQVKKDYGID